MQEQEHELHSKIDSVVARHEELSKTVAERHEQLARDLDELKKRPTKDRDLWDKLSTLTPLISGVLISAIGIYFTNSNNEAQRKIQEVQTIEKLMPHLAGSESEKKMAIIAISTLTNPETGARIAQLFPSKGTVSALQSIASQGSKKEKEVAKKALARSFTTLGETSEVHSVSDGEAEGYYQQALEMQKDVYGLDSAETVDTLVKIGRVNERQGKLDQAVASYEKARQIMLNNHREKSLDFRTILLCLARVYKESGKMSLASDFEERAERLGDDLAGTGDNNRVISVDNQAPPVPVGEDTRVNMPSPAPSIDDTTPDVAPSHGSDSETGIVGGVSAAPGQDGVGKMTAGSTSLMPSN
ncbi:MAG: tetratricopeptide repeat protein [Candidatus Obscuribacterales bacterium]